MYRKLALGLLPIAILVWGFLRYMHNFPRCFDIFLYDETMYMQRGRFFDPMEFASYEYSPLYPYFYRVMSLFVGDPVHLYMAGGILILFAAYLLSAISIFVLSRNGVLMVALTALSVFSQVYLTWPRVSFAAIALLAVAIPIALQFRRFSDKAALLALAAFILTFVRPEFVTSLYLLLIVAAVSFLAAIRTELKGITSGIGARWRKFAFPALCLAGIAALSILWSFPVMEGGGRSFLAFTQHYSLRHVTQNRSEMDPWLGTNQIIAGEFPGAKTVGDAFRISPRKVLGFYTQNLGELASQVVNSLAETMSSHARFLDLALLAFAICGIWRYRELKAAPEAHRLKLPTRNLLADLGLIAAFAISPLQSCIFVYPRTHYIIMLGFLACLLLARMVREINLPSSPGLAAVLCVGFLFAIKPLPVIDQPNVRMIEALRRLPPVPQMLEVDGGWCYYLSPPCTPVLLAEIGSETSLEALLREQKIGAVLVSPRMRVYEKYHPDNAVQGFLSEGGNHDGWTSYPLAPGYKIFYRQAEAPN